MRLRLLALALCWVAAVPARAAWLDRLDRGLGVASRDGVFRADLSGLLDLEGYYVDQRPPGLMFGGDSGFVNPRLTLFLDTRLGTHLYGFVETRFDRGFDPRSRFAAAHLDAYLLRWTPLDDARVNLQAGKFATLVGSWVPRHDSWNNPFVNAPLPYENVTIISDGSAPADAAAFLARRDLPDRKRDWVPVVWGPSYTTGAAIFGRVARLDYAAEVKNAALSARPQAWDATQRGFDQPTASGRLGWRPAPAWVLGASFSSGPYLRDRARRTLAADQEPGDFRETLVGADGRQLRLAAPAALGGVPRRALRGPARRRTAPVVRERGRRHRRLVRGGTLQVHAGVVRRAALEPAGVRRRVRRPRRRAGLGPERVAGRHRRRLPLPPAPPGQAAVRRRPAGGPAPAGRAAGRRAADTPLLIGLTARRRQR